MQAVCSMFAPIAVATIYTLWYGYREVLISRQRTLRKRVAFMLWMAAQQGRASRSSTPVLPVM